MSRTIQKRAASAVFLALSLLSLQGFAAEQPNILVIMADDVGWASLGSYHQGVKSIETPNLDRLAAEGVRLTDYYAQPSCTAGRSAFITGQFGKNHLGDLNEFLPTNRGFDEYWRWLPTLVAAAGRPDDLQERLRSGYQGHKVHLDGYNQLPFLKGESDSNRSEIFYYSGTRLQAVRYNDWKAHFVVQNHGWAGPAEALNAPLLYNLRRDPNEKAADESGM